MPGPTGNKPTLASLAKAVNVLTENQVEITSRLDAQESLNKKREESFAELKAESIYTNQMLKKLSQLFLTEEMPDKKERPKSHAIGTWSGWKIFGTFFGLLGGLIIGYRLLVPILIAINNAIMSVDIGGVVK